MKLKAVPFGQTFQFVEETDKGFFYSKIVPVDGVYDVPEKVYAATRCFVIAEYCLEILKIPVVILGEDDHDDGTPSGVVVDPALHRQLMFVYRDFRITGQLTIKHYSDEVNRFYCYMTKLQTGAGYIQPIELQQIVAAENVKTSRRAYTSKDGKSTIQTLSVTTDKFIVYGKTESHTPEVPFAFFMVFKDNVPVRIDRHLYPQLFNGLSDKIQSVQILYSRAVANYSMVPNVVVTSMDAFGEVVTSIVMFDNTDGSKSEPYPPALGEVLATAL